jgi:HD-GYP domain-containing protein (c-di-GMP phosphodiesterase class II)
MDERSIREKLFSDKVKILRCPTGDQKDSPYSPIYLSALMAGDHLTFSLYLKVADKGGTAIKYLPFWAPGEILQQAWLKRLNELGIDRLYLHKRDLDRSIAHLNNHLQVLRHQAPEHTQELLTVFSEHLNLSLRRALHSPRMGRSLQLAQNQVDDLLEVLQKEPRTLKMVWKILYKDYSLYNHSINVCLLGAAMMIHLRRPREECRAMALAGLFHDVGMTRMPQEVFSKEGRLSPEEWGEIKNHPWLGYQMLRAEVALACMPLEVMRLALEHHENADGSGYPQGLPLARQHPWTRVIRLLDSYESLTVSRPYRVALAPFATLKILQEERGPRGPIYDVQVLRNFIEFLTQA